jgi:hypothetical protein
MTESENEDVKEIQQCLDRTTGGWPGSHKYADINPRGFQGKLNCSIPVSFKRVRSTLSQYNVVWMLGDSLMAQMFYTLGCLMNSSIEAWDKSKISSGLWRTGLGFATPEQFVYNHSSGSTRFIYSRFGERWKLDDNLFKLDFPLAIKSLTARDAIFTNAAAVHYHLHMGTNFSKVVNHIIEQSHLTNATMFLMEQAPEEWATTNGNYVRTVKSCQCNHLTDDQLVGIESNFTCKEGRDLLLKQYRSNDYSTPLVPNFWRIDIMRKALERSNHNLHLIPIYWQLLSRDGGSFKHDGDCTHKDLLSTITMIFQWTRVIIGLQ